MAKTTNESRLNESEIIEFLKENCQWEDFKHHHWAFVARVLHIEINIRTSKEQKHWITISPDEFCPHVKIPITPMKNNTKIYVENLQDGNWHYNLIEYPKHGVMNLYLRAKPRKT